MKGEAVWDAFAWRTECCAAPSFELWVSVSVSFSTVVKYGRSFNRSSPARLVKGSAFRVAGRTTACSHPLCQSNEGLPQGATRATGALVAMPPAASIANMRWHGSRGNTKVAESTSRF